MADPNDSSLAFFSKATPKQWRFVYELRRDAIQLKADQRSFKKGGPEELIKLDTWFREKLPSLIHSRKDPHVLYEELVQIAKWRLMMGKYRPKMLDLVRINTESSVMNITRKALKKLQQQKNLQQAITQLVNLKGIGPSTASAVLAAVYPEEAPFMSDEGMLSTPGVEATDSTIAEYINYSEQLRNKTDSLRQLDPEYKWTPHKVDQVLWTYYLTKDLKPNLLEAMPRSDDAVTTHLLDAVDDNANLMAPSTAVESALIDGDEESSSQDVLNETSLNGTYNDDSESASVHYSEEEISQGAGMALENSRIEIVGLDCLSSAPNIPTLSNSSMNSQFVDTTMISDSKNTANPTSNGAAIKSSSNIGEDSNFSEDQEPATGQRLLLINENPASPPTSMLTPSEENSVDNDEVSLDEAPPMKKQKTGLELGAVLTAATAEPTGAEA
ncbi:hypothetical protein SSS_02776 [Sarcoptes scabiei]|uniref:Uncharacterized protein n=1 Tax=Sarcoptes scabiei TaxID=52283 RepID=A0A834RFW0_SARSC|nr:hypothetical protein SSS_02776 [Sarcoptes scabiei]